jgi:hypothetical protein
MNQAELLMNQARSAWNDAADALHLHQQTVHSLAVRLSSHHIAGRQRLRDEETAAFLKWDMSDEESDYDVFDDLHTQLVMLDREIDSTRDEMEGVRLTLAELAIQESNARDHFYKAYANYLKADEIAESIRGRVVDDYYPDNESEDPL